MKKLTAVFFLLGSFILFGGFLFAVSAFNLFYPSVKDPDFWKKSYEAMKLLSIINMSWSIGGFFLIFVSSILFIFTPEKEKELEKK